MARLAELALSDDIVFFYNNSFDDCQMKTTLFFSFHGYLLFFALSRSFITLALGLIFQDDLYVLLQHLSNALIQKLYRYIYIFFFGKSAVHFL
jgi:hypothetical protein